MIIFEAQKSKSPKMVRPQTVKSLRTPKDKQHNTPNAIQLTETKKAALFLGMPQDSMTYAVTDSCNDIALVSAAKSKSR